jgi:CBS domain-containing protein
MNEDIREVMTPMPCTVPSNVSVVYAARAMRENDIGTVVVVDEVRLFGIVTDRDIVVRVLAEELDPRATTVADICSRNLTTVKPTDSVASAVRLMRDKALRRLPVVEDDGSVVGILSLGDLAVGRDRRSTLGDISAAPPNL